MSLKTQLELLASAIGTDVKGLRNIIAPLAGLTTTDKTTIVAAINEIKTAVNSADTRIGGDLSAIAAAFGSTGNKDIVEALTALKSNVDTAQGSVDNLIDDTAVAGSVTKAYSVDKVIALIDAAKTSILGGLAPEALDTITELADFLTDGSVASGLIAQLSKRVRVDAAQTFTAAEQTQARDNIGAAKETVLTELTAAVGDTNTDFVSTYNVALV